MEYPELSRCFFFSQILMNAIVMVKVDATSSLAAYLPVTAENICFPKS